MGLQSRPWRRGPGVNGWLNHYDKCVLWRRLDMNELYDACLRLGKMMALDGWPLLTQNYGLSPWKKVASRFSLCCKAASGIASLTPSVKGCVVDRFWPQVFNHKIWRSKLSMGSFPAHIFLFGGWVLPCLGRWLLKSCCDVLDFWTAKMGKNR